MQHIKTEPHTEASCRFTKLLCATRERGKDAELARYEPWMVNRGRSECRDHYFGSFA